MSKKRILIILVAVLLVLVLLGGAGFVFWAASASAPMPQALDALQSDAQVKVQTEPWFIFRPVSAEPKTGLVLYPGGRVDARAYAPQAHAIAAQGYLVVIVPVPLNLAFFAPDKAQEVIAAYPGIRRWVVGGHSLGGVAAATFAKRHPDTVKGLVLWASYPADTDSLANGDLAVTSIYGSEDRLATGTKIEASRSLLPQSTRWVSILGGNHGQFGWYGLQGGDGEATISRETQQQLIVRATVDLLMVVEKK